MFILYIQYTVVPLSSQRILNRFSGLFVELKGVVPKASVWIVFDNICRISFQQVSQLYLYLLLGAILLWTVLPIYYYTSENPSRFGWQTPSTCGLAHPPLMANLVHKFAVFSFWPQIDGCQFTLTSVKCFSPCLGVRSHLTNSPYKKGRKKKEWLTYSVAINLQ